MTTYSPQTRPGTLVLLRHGESEWNKANLFTGWVDVPLSEKGRGEAARGGELLAEHGLLPEVAHTSVLRRAIATADFLDEGRVRERVDLHLGRIADGDARDVRLVHLHPRLEDRHVGDRQEGRRVAVEASSSAVRLAPSTGVPGPDGIRRRPHRGRPRLNPPYSFFPCRSLC